MHSSLSRHRGVLLGAALAFVAMLLIVPATYAIPADPSGGPAGPLVVRAAPPPSQTAAKQAAQHPRPPITPARHPLGAARPVAAPSGPAVQVPILMYHYIRVNANPRDLLGADLSVTPAHFAAQMDWLAAHGYQTVTLDQIVAALHTGAPLPPKPVALTFDDGYADFYTAAYPVLQRLGFHATSFIITGKVGWLGYLTWDEMQTMQASGLVTFGAHTVNHVELAHIPLLKAQYELVTSKSTLETHLGRPVRYLSYPSGDYDTAVKNLVAQDGFQAGVTTQPGAVEHSSTLLTLPRVRIHGSDSMTSFAGHLGVWGPAAGAVYQAPAIQPRRPAGVRARAVLPR